MFDDSSFINEPRIETKSPGNISGYGNSSFGSKNCIAEIVEVPSSHTNMIRLAFFSILTIIPTICTFNNGFDSIENKYMVGVAEEVDDDDDDDDDDVDLTLTSYLICEINNFL